MGAYNQVDKRSITDLQATLFEVGFVYASASIHQGWWLDETGELPVLGFSVKPVA